MVKFWQTGWSRAERKPFLATIYPTLQELRECGPTKAGGSGTPSLPMGRGELPHNSWVRKDIHIKP